VNDATPRWGWIAGPIAQQVVPGRIVANVVGTVPKYSWAYVRTLRDQLNEAIFVGLGCPGAFGNPLGPTDCSGGAKTVLFTGAIPNGPGGWTASSMQRTVIGGMPHPSLNGSRQLGATHLAAVTF
jgi:hypothetical protein